ncbi:MAG: ATP-binding cassette domain-containing protein, partial [Calditrichaeota bacterium]
MLIELVEIKNFRTIKDTLFKCNNLTAIVGRNGSGKSTILHALNYYYDTNAPVNVEDFFHRNTDEKIVIKVTYTNLSDEEKLEFKLYITENKLIVSKIISFDDGRITQKYYANELQIPEFAIVRKNESKTEIRSAYNKLVNDNSIEGLSETARSADLAEKYMVEFEKLNPKLLMPIEREVQFFGPKNIGGGKLDKYTKYIFIPAVKNVLEETESKKGAITQLLELIVLRKINTRKDIIKFREEYDAKIKEVYSTDNLTEIKELGGVLTETLKQYAPGAELNLQWEEVVPPELSLPKSTASLIEDEYDGDI